MLMITNIKAMNNMEPITTGISAISKASTVALPKPL